MWGLGHCEVYDFKYNCKTHERHHDAKDVCKTSSIATWTSWRHSRNGGRGVAHRMEAQKKWCHVSGEPSYLVEHAIKIVMMKVQLWPFILDYPKVCGCYLVFFFIDYLFLIGMQSTEDKKTIILNKNIENNVDYGFKFD
jgi:hypothetical protein